MVEPVRIKGFAVTYDRKFNCGNFESLNPAITIWVKMRVPEGATLDLHGCKERVRRMARENVRRQWQRLQGDDDVVFLCLPAPAGSDEDPVVVGTVSLSLAYKVNLGNYQSVAPRYTDWADVQHAAHSPGALHITLERMWAGLWNNVRDEISRAQDKEPTGAFFGQPALEVEDLTAASGPDGRVSVANGSRT